MHRAAALSALLALGPPVAAQESLPGRFERLLRMPTHHMLMRSLDEAPPLAPFATDGCSGGLSGAWRIVSDLFPNFAEAQGGRPPWEACCAAHDVVYHDAGGARTAAESYLARRDADDALRQCVLISGAARAPDVAAHYGVDVLQVQGAYAAVAQAMYDAVRLGGAPCSGMPWRWGYGYPDCHPVVQ